MKILAFDSNSIISRAFYGIRPLTTKDGIPTNAVYGFFNIVHRLVGDERPDYLVFCFDMHAPTFRHRLYSGYKATRKGMPEELRTQMPLIKEMLAYLGYPVLEKEGYEADDLLGSLAKAGERRGHEVLICTGDRDALQLITDRVTVILAKTAPGGAVYEHMTPETVRERYQVTPEELIEVKALMGDSSDNIPGVPGIGEKGATRLIRDYHSIGYIFGHLGELPLTPSTRGKLEKGRALAELSRSLGTICTEVPLPGWEALVPGRREDGKLYAFLARLELNRLIARLGLTPPEERTPPEGKPDAWTLERGNGSESPDGFGPTPAVALDFAEDGETVRNAAVAGGGRVLLVTDPPEAFLKKLFEGDAPLLSEDSKPLHRLAISLGTNVRKIRLDARLAGYLINPNAPDYSVRRQLEADGRALPAVRPEAPFPGCVSRAAGLQTLAPILQKTIRENGQEALLSDVEQPLAGVLASMEREGFGIDLSGLCEFGDGLSGMIRSLGEEIQELAGHPFNLNSPMQLGTVLFEELDLPAGRKTRRGYSTDAEVLERLIPAHPIVGKILEYRTCAKLFSTYVTGLRNAVGGDGRIHTSFNQTETRTGRISSAEPNLQNIPVRSEPGSRMRTFFTAGEGHVLVDADYSQIELRVLAAISGDRVMTEAFRNGEDIHARTAAQVFDLPPELVTPRLRARAKAVNFGIVYGIGAFSLSRDIGVPRGVAESYIANYKKTYSGIAAYLDGSVASAREKGYAETLLGRRRPLPELRASSRAQRAFGERVAMNMPIQGTAADIIKIAMVRVYRRLRKELPDAKLVLQVHDELIVEVPEGEAERARELVRAEMEHAMDLPVPLVVETGIGRTWAEAH